MTRALEDAAALLEDVGELAIGELDAMARVAPAFAFYGPWARARAPEPRELARAVKRARRAIDDVRHVGGRWSVRFAELAAVVLELCELNARSMRPGLAPDRGNGTP